ncbi:MAG: PrsW family intramembrane metalloprotease [Parcubacteria group bacterium]|nr:PrsW family intramembrane metalloprotease [Parcubacteria group bacterium]
MVLFLSILLGSAPALGWFYFYLKEEVHPEPWSKITRTFISGIAIAPVVVLLETYLSKPLASNFDPSWILFLSFLIAAAIEEGCKFFAALPMEHDKAMDAPVDAMIYAVTASLGFATAENILLTLREIYTIIPEIHSFTLANISILSPAVEILSLRFMGATLLHTLATGILGYYWALSIRDGHNRHLIKGFALAVGLHTFFNYLIIYYGGASFIYTSSILLFAAFFLLQDFETLKRKPLPINLN